MSINMTQHFVFESDDLKSVQAVLHAIVPVLFHDNGQYVKLHMKKEKPFSYSDGRDYSAKYHNQRKMIQINSDWHMVESHSTYGGATVLKTIEKYKTSDAAAKAVCDHDKKIRDPDPTRYWVATFADYKSGVREGDVSFESYMELIDNAISAFKEADFSAFNDACGTGHNGFFNAFDGSIGVGYRISFRPNGGWNELDLSLVHAYYGK